MREELVMLTTVKALVVDDSAVARKVLSSILLREGLESDAVSSAAAAFTYLLKNVPDVIFLDHMMPEMDGFDALRLMKADPDTAKIPVIMFTSRSGEAYLNEAQALGAVEVLSKDTLAEINLTQWLQQLGILKSESSRATTARLRPGVSEVPDKQTLTVPLVRGLVREEFSRLREDLPEMIRQAQQDENELPPRQVPGDFYPSRLQSPDSSRSFWRLAWIPLALIGSMLILWTLSMPHRGMELSQQPTAVAAVKIKKNDAGVVGIANNNSTAYTDRSLKIIGWAINQKMRYKLGELPLANERLEDLRGMLSMLQEADFQGTVQLMVHQGKFCVVTDSAGRTRLPSSGALMNDCTIQTLQTAGAVSQLMSLPFALFIDSSPQANGEEGIRVSVISSASENPLIQYPQTKPNMIAADWNQIAVENNRVEVRFLNANLR